MEVVGEVSLTKASTSNNKTANNKTQISQNTSKVELETTKTWENQKNL
jgi:hypothetical protein